MCMYSCRLLFSSQLVAAVHEAGRAASEARDRGSPSPVQEAGELGYGLAGGEQPALQVSTAEPLHVFVFLTLSTFALSMLKAFAIAVLRCGIVGELGESGQRGLVERLTAQLAAAGQVGLGGPQAELSVPAAVVALEGAHELATWGHGDWKFDITVSVPPFRICRVMRFDGCTG
jgi:hypothetical protein